MRAGAGNVGCYGVVANVWPQTIVQTCVVRLIRNTFRLVSRRDWDVVKRDIKPIHTAPGPDVAIAALDEFEGKWGAQHSAVIRLWRNAWDEFAPFLDYDIEIRCMIYSTNAIESVNARYRRAILATRSLDPTGAGRARWTMRWKPVINAFVITFGDRWPGAETC
ncbi:transposase mutator type [Amycolatopsis keratiniphila]|uniref:Mutator family transposase n=1 Tax=Amycolatopsis keratiniphila TaxID=129921 RepID=R4SXB0_9PSEU|nr:transposase mutator type [Amycolatopsis keratiniphila]